MGARMNPCEDDDSFADPDEDHSSPYEDYCYSHPLKSRGRLRGDGCLPGPTFEDLESEFEASTYQR